MSNLFTQQGVDFDTWFSVGSGQQYFNIYSNNGQDIGNIYLAGSGGPDTSWKDSSGADLSTKLGGYGYGIYRVGGVPWNAYVANTFDHGSMFDWWKSWLNTFNSKRTPCKYIAGIMDDSYYRNVCSDNGHSICIFGYSPTGAEINFSYQERNREYGCSNRSHYMYSYPITINSRLKGLVIIRGCGAGDDPCSEFYVTLSQAGQNTLYYNGVYGCVNDDNNPNYGTYGWNVWKWNKQWYWHS